jgi:hypothetical protein
VPVGVALMGVVLISDVVVSTDGKPFPISWLLSDSLEDTDSVLSRGGGS